MSRYARFKVFSPLYGASYTALFLYSEACQCAWFRYYPVLGRFSGEPLPLAEAGLPINWYSWVLAAFLISVVGMVIVPRSLAARMPGSVVWGLTLVVILVIVVYERRWFY